MCSCGMPSYVCSREITTDPIPEIKEQDNE